MILRLLKKNWILNTLVIFDLLFVILHFYFVNYSLFNLDKESNLPTVYQGLKLLFFGGSIFFGLFYIGFEKLRKVVPIKDLIIYSLSSLFFIYLGMDEVSMIHERVSNYVYEFNQSFSAVIIQSAVDSGYQGALWIIYYLPIIVFVITPIVFSYIYYVFCKNKLNALMIVLGYFILLGVPIVEIINTRRAYEFVELMNWIAIEEGLEMFGVSILGYGVFRDFQTYRNQKLELLTKQDSTNPEPKLKAELK